jgi:transposase
MLDVHTLNAQDLRCLSSEALVAAAEQMRQRIDAQSKQLDAQAQAIKFKDAKLEKITFELARLKAWRFGAKTEAMNAEQRQMFDEAMAEDQASLEAQLLALQGGVPATEPAPVAVKRQPRRRRCPSTCDVLSITTSPRTPPARRRIAASRWCASAKT